MVDTDRYELRQAGVPVTIEPEVFDVLAHLVLNRARVVTKHELLDVVWGDRSVSESTLAGRIISLRRCVDDDDVNQRVIRTVFGRGYQFVADASVVTPADVAQPTVAGAGRSASAPVRPLPEQDIRFCHAADGTRIAYATVGSGPALVKAANWMTHLDYDRESRVWRHWIEGLADGRSLLRYDERGCGLSDWDVEQDFETWVDDLEAVVDEAGLDRFPLLGVSQGGAVAIAYAVRHPERVSRLVLYGAYGRGRLVRAGGDAKLEAEAALDVELARIGWGRDDPSFRQVFTAQFLPDGSREDWDDLNDLLRRTTSPDNAVRFLETFARIDVTDRASRVRCPTLILHARDDHRVPLSAARELATLIPYSTLIPLPGRNHILTRDEPAWPMFLRELDRFLDVERPTVSTRPA